MPSVEEKVEEYFKKILDANKVRHYGKTEKMNSAIASALKNADSKSGGSGCNFPDIQMMLENSNARRIPVMVEAKGMRSKLEKTDKTGAIIGVTYYDKDGKTGKNGKPSHLKGEPNYSAVKDYAVNGAVHYGNAVLDEGTYNEAIVVGINGTALDDQEKIGVYTDAYIVKLKSKEMSKELGLYLTSAMNQSIHNHQKKKYSRGYKAIWTGRVENDDILLPIQTSHDGKPIIDPDRTYHPDGYIPDWEYMEKYIKATEKEIIKEVVLYKDKVIAKAKEITEVA